MNTLKGQLVNQQMDLLFFFWLPFGMEVIAEPFF